MTTKTKFKPKRVSKADRISVHALRKTELPEAKRIFHLAFGTFLGLPDPMQFFPDRDFVRTRYHTDPSGAVGASIGGKLIGSNFATDWGSVGFFGPLTIRPDFWDRGVAQRLLERTMKRFAQWGTEHIGLFTFAHSARHIGLYQKFGFWPRFLTAIMSKPVSVVRRRTDWTTFSDSAEKDQPVILKAISKLTNSIYDGLNPVREVMGVHNQRLGETVLLWDKSRLEGFAICHGGPETEAGGGNCYVKFGAVRAGRTAARAFGQLLDACESLAHQRGLSRLEAGVNLAREETYYRMRTRGFRTEMQGVAMQRPNEAGYNRPGVYLIDDWR